MTQHIRASTETLVQQATQTACDYMTRAVLDIDDLMGEGYAKKHPELIAAYIQTAAIDYGSSIIARALGDIDDSLEGFGPR